MGTFEAFYASPAQHPFLLWVAVAAALAYCRSRGAIPSSVRRYCVALGGLSLLDAWLTSAHIYGIGNLEGIAASAVPLFFVLAGDFRFLLLAVAGGTGGRLAIDPRGLLVAAALTALVPITTQVVLRLLPESLNEARVMFFIYEVLFVLLTLALLRFNENVRGNAWVSRIARYVIVYYSLWATADVFILATGADVGYLLRVIPNVLYYGGLIAAIGWSAEKGAIEAGSRRP